ncbi:YciI family protein [Nocardiopsis sp. NPDC006139]|uniref:YciI family protein n=1 Tax=Nocardiopsis sp. NPDC006139 TaxID=3154578 RepID=UPI0033B77F2B
MVTWNDDEEEEPAMRYALLLHNAEPAEGEIPQGAVEAVQEAFGAYGRALEAAGVLVAAEVLATPRVTTTLTRREGGLRVQDGPFADTKEALAGVFVIDVPDLDAALAWAEKCPGAQYGVLEVRPAATSYIDGAWT